MNWPWLKKKRRIEPQSAELTEALKHLEECENWLNHRTRVQGSSNNETLTTVPSAIRGVDGLNTTPNA